MGRNSLNGATDEETQSSFGKSASRFARTTAEKARDYRRRKLAEKRAWGPREIEIRRWQRAAITPPATALATLGAGQCAHFMAMQAATSTGGAAALAGLSVAGVAFVVRVAGKTIFLPRWESLYWSVAGIVTVWMAATTALGLSWISTALLVAFTAVFARPWMRGHPQPDYEQAAIPAVETLELEPASDENEELVEEILERFDAFIAARGKKLEGAMLTNMESLATGWRFDVEVDVDKHTTKDVLDLQEKIAAVMGDLGMGVDDIIPEPHPTGHRGKAQLTFTTTNPLKRGVPYQGPRYNNGEIAVGPWRDGEGWGSIVLTDHKNSVYNGLVTGDPGMGKSVFLENLGMSALSSGCWQVFYTDGSEDADSSALLNKYMTWSEAGLKGARRQLAAVKNYLEMRGVENNATGTRGVNPSPERVGLLWIIDELHRLATADPEFAAELAQVVRLGRKKGVSVWGATQGTDLKEDFGSVTALRDILTSRNVAACYSSSKYGHSLISGAALAPNTLPNDGGYMYLKTPGMSRYAMLRTDYAEDMTRWAAAIPECPWDENGYLSVKKHLEENQTDESAKRDKARRRLEALKTRLKHGIDLTESDNNADDSVSSAATSVTAPIDNLIAMIPRLDQGPSQQPSPDQEDELDRVHHAILGLVREGVAATGEIVERMRARDVSERTTKRKLAELVKQGHLATGIKQGIYELPAA
ncbi:hypothetical protein [Saccharopolyspora griseoalba]|uniref:Uncharacterized protein n=1 Tax=Saccharopolyspora griseoalba TaxID=1431848 RepID=A0ABW2LQ33_9PSEU